MRKIVYAAMVLFAMSGFARAQSSDLGSQLGKVGEQYAKGYLAPAVNAFGVDLNSGLFHGATMGGLLPLGLHVYLGVQIGTMLVGNSDKSFSMSYQDSLDEPIFGKVPATYTVTDAPTIFGGKTPGTIVAHPNEFPLQQDSITTIPGVVNTSIAFLPIPQLGVGSIFGTDLMVRFLPKLKIGNYGSVQMLGLAVRHNISQYLPLVPVDIAVQLGWQNFSVSDTASKILDATALAANVEVSKTFAILTLYGGLQVESSSFDVSYRYTPPSTNSKPNPTPVPISFNMKGKNSFRGLIGLSLGLGVLTINADYSIGSVSAVTAGIGVGI